MTEIIGISTTCSNSDGVVRATLHLAEDFEPYMSNSEKGRNCIGQSVSQLYVGEYDISSFKVGDKIEVFYGKAFTTKTGVYQPIELIRKIETKK